MKGSGIAGIIIQSGTNLTESWQGNTSSELLRVHKLVLEALEILLLGRFEEDHPRDECLSKVAFNMVMDLINNPGTETASKLNDSEEFRRNFEKYKAFKSEALDGAHG